jgi:glycosyltransferase involved in cell wall biosynthesis
MKIRLTHYGLKNVQVIYNRIDINEIESAVSNEKDHDANDASKIILNPTGYIGEYKGFSHFLQLAKHLKPKYGKLIEFIATGYIGNGIVKGVGYIPRPDYLRLLARSFLVVIPALWEEPASMVPLEAMAMGKPIVAYASGGFREIVKNGETGLLIPRGNIKALIDAVDYLINDPEVAIKMGLKGKDRIKRLFSADRMVMEYEKVLFNVLR